MDATQGSVGLLMRSWRRRSLAQELDDSDLKLMANLRHLNEAYVKLREFANDRN